MTKIDALMTLIGEAYSEKTSLTGYKRCLRAIGVLALSIEEASRVLSRLDYTDSEGCTYSWLTKALCDAREKKATAKMARK